MSTPNQAYVSGSVPFGGLTVNIYRLSDPDSNSSGVLLGAYKVESATPNITATLNKRPDIDGGKNGWWLINGDTEGSAVIQRATAATPSILTGDYFEAGIRRDASGNAVTERFVIYNPSEPQDASYRKVSCSIIVDTEA